MSDSAIIQDCLIHHSNQHIQLRKDFLAICAYDPKDFNLKRNGKGQIIKDEPNQECMAKILRLLETFTNDERANWFRKTLAAKERGLHAPTEPQEYPIELTYNAIYKLLYFTHGENCIRNCVAVLIDRGYAKRSQATINSIPRYVFCVQVVQQALNQFEEQQIQTEGVLRITPRQRRVKSDEGVLRITPQGVENKALGVENKALGVENNTTNILSNITTNKLPKIDTVVAIADDASLTFSSSPQSENGSHSEPLETNLQPQNSTSSPIIEPSVLPSQNVENALSAINSSNEIGTAGNGSQVAKQEASDVDHIADEAEKPAKKAKVELTEAEQELVTRRRYWQERINGWRGAPLPTKGGAMNETTTLKKLVADYTDAQIDAIIRHMISQNWKYKQNPRTIGGKEILFEAGPTSGLLKDLKSWPAQSVKMEKPVEVSANIIQFPTQANVNTNPYPKAAASMPNLEKFEALLASGTPEFILLTKEEINRLKGGNRKTYHQMLFAQQVAARA